MIFHKHAKKCMQSSNFYIDNEPVEIVQSCIYLETVISSTGNFTLALLTPAFKCEYSPSSYLDLTSKLSERKDLVKFRVGNRKLRIETRRYDQIPSANRLLYL